MKKCAGDGMEFGYDHEYYKDPMNWREGEGLSLNLRRATGDPKAFREKLDSKIKQKLKKADNK